MKKTVILFSVLLLAGCNQHKSIETSPTVEITEKSSEALIAAQGNGKAATMITQEENTRPNRIANKTQQAEPVKVKAIYVSGPMAGSSGMESLIQLVKDTELNGMVIDIKNDSGQVTYKMQSETVAAVSAGINYIPEMQELITRLKAEGIYTIARIVAFKDPILADKRPDLSLKTKDGEIFRDNKGLAWVNPYKQEVWDYLVEVGVQAANLGFDEIQFDYIRFSTDANMSQVDFGKEADEKSKTQIITEFSKYMTDKLTPLGVYVSADVYGTIIDSPIDSDIVGQNYGEMANYMNYICPMIYPSHYSNGSFGIEFPDTQPYETILAALTASKEELAKSKTGEEQAKVRVWLQDFTASWIPNHISYGPEQIRQQIQAVYDSGYEEWILWNAKNNYTKDGLSAEE